MEQIGFLDVCLVGIQRGRRRRRGGSPGSMMDMEFTLKEWGGEVMRIGRGPEHASTRVSLVELLRSRPIGRNTAPLFSPLAAPLLPLPAVPLLISSSRRPILNRINNAELLTGLRKLASDKDPQSKWRAVKLQRKAKLAALVKKQTGEDIDINSMFDIQVGSY